MSHACHECLHYAFPDWKVEEVGRCKLAQERFGRELKLPTYAPACKGFEKKDQGQRPGRRR